MLSEARKAVFSRLACLLVCYRPLAQIPIRPRFLSIRFLRRGRFASLEESCRRCRLDKKLSGKRWMSRPISGAAATHPLRSYARASRLVRPLPPVLNLGPNSRVAATSDRPGAPGGETVAAGERSREGSNPRRLSAPPATDDPGRLADVRPDRHLVFTTTRRNCVI